MTRGPYSRDGFTSSLRGFAAISKRACEALSRRLPPGCGAFETVVKSWEHAFNSGLVIDRGGEVSFPLWKSPRDYDKGVPSDALLATLKLNKDGKWVLVFAGPDRHHALDVFRDHMEVPRSIYDFAYVDWDRIAADVSAHAMDEPWGFSPGDASILKSYVTYTFQRAAFQGRVAVSEELAIAAFDTGLANQMYEDLYLCFEPNNGRGRRWRYRGLCVAGERGLGKELVDAFPDLPPRASYIENANDLTYDASRNLYVDYDHIVVDNVQRLPVQFLRNEAYDRPGFSSLLDAVGSGGDTRPAYDAIREALRDDDMLRLRLRNRLDDAIVLAKRRTQWNYRTAVPCYYPAEESMSLLLPLCLLSPSVPDAALVISLSSKGSYQGETVLTLRQAYLDARLICRPENDWLVP